MDVREKHAPISSHRRPHSGLHPGAPTSARALRGDAPTASAGTDQLRPFAATLPLLGGSRLTLRAGREGSFLLLITS